MEADLGFLLLFEPELDDNFAVAIENADVFRRASHIVRLGADLIIDV